MNKNKLPKLVLFVFVAELLIGCTGAPLEYTRKIQPSTSNKWFLLDEEYTEVQMTGLMKDFRWETGLIKGRYNLVQENDVGEFYKGPGYCVVLYTPFDGEIWHYEGGLWVPKDRSSRAPKLFYYYSNKKNGGVPEGAGIAVGAILFMGEGRLEFLPDREDPDIWNVVKIQTDDVAS